MIRVFIAEDEIVELNALKRIDYKSVGMQIVGTATDGESAIEQIRQLKPDVLISDIVMPKKSGLDILRFAKDIQPDIYSILITAHHDFEYAHAAIKYGVDKFLAKPFLLTQLYNDLKEVSDLICTRRRIAFDQELFNREKEKYIPIFRENFVRSLIEGTTYHDINQRFAFYDIPAITPPVSALCVIADEHTDSSLLMLRRCVSALFQAENRACCYATLTPSHHAVLCVLFQCRADDNANTFYNLAEHLRVSALTTYGFHVCVGVGSLGNSLEDISTCASHALQALDYRFYLDSQAVVVFHDIVGEERTGSAQQLRQTFSSILLAIDKGDTNALEGCFTKLYRIASVSSMPIYQLRILLSELMLRIISHHYDFDQDSNYTLWMSVSNSIFAAETLTDIVDIVRNETTKLRTQAENTIAVRQEYLVHTIKKLIDSNYAQITGIDSITEQIGISSGYASRLFRQHTGESINGYLIHTRMVAAAKLLVNTPAGISQIAVQVGYANSPYFSSLFRKTYGCSPREWRERHGRLFKEAQE